MADYQNKRIDIAKLDKRAIEKVSSDIVRALSEVAADNPEAKGKFYLKVRLPPVTFSRHIEVIVGNPEPEAPPEG